MKLQHYGAIAAIAVLAGLSAPSVQASNPQHLERLYRTGICTRCDLRRANLRRADLRNVDLRGSNLRGANLENADLRGANLQNVDFRDADLRGADFRNADLRGVTTRGARTQNTRGLLDYDDHRGGRHDDRRDDRSGGRYNDRDTTARSRETINRLYQEVLGRSADRRGLEAHARELERGMSLASIRRHLARSDEAPRSH